MNQLPSTQPPRAALVTGAAQRIGRTIALALAEAVGDGRIQPGHLVLMEALGGGLTWGASVARW